MRRIERQEEEDDYLKDMRETEFKKQQEIDQLEQDELSKFNKRRIEVDTILDAPVHKAAKNRVKPKRQEPKKIDISKLIRKKKVTNPLP
jgi:hypothetical protein